MIIPTTYTAAYAWIKGLRGEKIYTPAGKRYAVAVESEAGEMLAAVILGIPDAPRHHFLKDGRTLEALAAFTHRETDGAEIYQAAARLCFALGYARLVTYSGPGDNRTAEALRLAGFTKAGRDHTRARLRWIKERGPEE